MSEHPNQDDQPFDEYLYGKLEDEYHRRMDQAADELLGDLDNWQPTGIDVEDE